MRTTIISSKDLFGSGLNPTGKMSAGRAMLIDAIMSERELTIEDVNDILEQEFSTKRKLADFKADLTACADKSAILAYVYRTLGFAPKTKQEIDGIERFIYVIYKDESDRIATQAAKNFAKARDIKEKSLFFSTEQKEQNKWDLINADANCDHFVELRASGYGCTKCSGWYCE